ncbi:MAG: hypothetical protein ACXAEN_23515 [Candidatus Thorarchaeota archaeon]|jgi:hypothetical protein
MKFFIVAEDRFGMGVWVNDRPLRPRAWTEPSVAEYLGQICWLDTEAPLCEFTT